MRFLRRLGVTLCIVVSVLLVFIICLPTLLSTTVGRSAALSIANTCYDGSISVDDLSVSWLSGIDLKGLRIADRRNRDLLTCQRFVFEKSLLSLLFSHRDIGSVVIHSPAMYAYVSSEKDHHGSHGSSSPHKKPVQKAAGPAFVSPLGLPDVRGKIAIDNASFVSMKDNRVVGAVTEGTLAADLNLWQTSKATFSASLSQGEAPKVPVSVTMALQGNQDVSKCQGSLHVSCENIPTEVIAILSDAINPSLSDLVREAFGSTVSYTLDATIEGPKAVATSKLESDNVRSSIEASLNGSTVTLKEGPLFTGTMTPTLFSSLHVLDAKLSKATSFLIENKTPLSFDIATCNFLSPFSLRLASQNPAQILFDQAPPITCSFEGVVQGEASHPTGSFVFKASTPQASADATLDCSAVDQGAAYHVTSRLLMTGGWPSIASVVSKQTVPAFIGPVVTFKAMCEGDFLKDSSGFSLITSADLTANQLQGTLGLSIEQKGRELIFSTPPTATVQLSPELLKSTTIQKPLTVTARLSPFSMSAEKDGSLPKKLCGEIQTDTIDLPENQSVVVTLPFSVDFQDREGSATVRLTDAKSKSDILQTTLSATLPKTYADLTGPLSLQITTKGTITPEILKGVTSALKLSQPISITQPVMFAIDPLTCTFELDSILHGAFSTAALLNTTNLKTSLTLSPITLRRNQHELGSLAALEGKLSLDGPAKTLSFAFTAPSGEREDMITMDIQGRCENLWNQDGFTPAQSRINTTVAISGLPTRLVELALPEKAELLEKSVGKTVKLSGFASIEKMKTGAVKFDLTAKHCSVHIDGVIQDGSLSLKTPATASLEVTEKAGALLLKDVNPLLATAVNSKQPLRVSIDPAGASIPLSPFCLSTVRLPKITADVGQIVVKNGGALKIIMALLGLGKAASSDTVDLWLTPVYLRLENGVLTCQRTDALAAEKLHLITWGTVDLAHENINMIVAIPQDCLQKLHIEIITPTPDRGLQIPITGSTSNPNIETKRATAKLAGAGMYVTGNAHAAIIGGLLQAAASVGSDDQTIPPPTTQPFPWAGR